VSPRRIRGRPARGLLLLPLLLLATRAGAVSTCVSDCTQTACTVGCSEDELRDAVAKANNCLGNGGWTGRTITVDAGMPACTIPMLNDVAKANAWPNSSCPSDPEAYSLCFKNDGIRLRGGGAVFLYVGDGLCRQCTEECPPPQPALVTFRGNNDGVEDLTYLYFPEGLHVRAGTGHTIARVKSDRICEDAITLDVTAGTGNTIADSTLVGSTTPDPGRSCLLPTGDAGLCGTDKAIQLNGGGVTIVHNTIDMISQPVHSQAGTHTLLANTTTGSASDDNLCQSYTFTGPSVITMQGNTIDHCKFGIHVDSSALVRADGNIITNPWLAAFDVRGDGRLRAEGNRMRTRSTGFTTLSSVQSGLLVARNDGRARVDFGGGDFAGLSVVDDTPCAGGGDCSSGLNRFCSSGTGVQVDIWNVTDCPCQNQLCNGAIGNCTLGSCAPLDAAGVCLGSAGGGASIGARSNCFQSNGDPLTTVRDAGSSTTAVDGATECDPSACDF